MKYKRKLWIAVSFFAFFIFAALMKSPTAIYAGEAAAKIIESGQGEETLAKETLTEEALAGDDITERTAFSGSYNTADAYDQLTLGQSVQMWGLTNAFGYGERQYIFALKNGDN